MHKSATKCNETIGKWCKNKHGASKIIDTLETYHITEGKLTAVLIIPSSWGFPTSPVRHQRFFLAPLPGRKRISARGVSHFQSFYFVIILLSFFTLFCLHLVYQKYKKISSFYSCYFCLSVLVLLE
jgi:hypothetical protein